MPRLIVPVLASAALIGGYGVARATGVRWAGGAALVALDAAAAAVVLRQAGGLRAAVVAGTVVAAFGASHPLAKRLGAWPSVLAVTAVAAVPAAVLADR